MVGWHAPVATPQAQLMQCLFVGMQDTLGNTLPVDAAASAGEEDPAGDAEDADVYERDAADAEPHDHVKLVPRPPAWPPSRRTSGNTARPRSPKTKRPRSPPPPPTARIAPAGSAPSTEEGQNASEKCWWHWS